MWKAGRKFHTRNQYGKKRKKSLLENFKGRSVSARSAERASDPPSVASGKASDNIGLAPPPPPAQDNASGSGRVRLDTAVLHPLEVAEVRRNAENKLQELASTGATQRKCGLLADIDDAAATLLDETRFSIVSLDQVNELTRAVKCKLCSGDENIGKEDREVLPTVVGGGFAVHLSGRPSTSPVGRPPLPTSRGSSLLYSGKTGTYECETPARQLPQARTEGRGTVRLLPIFEEGYAHATVASSEPACQELLFT
ncbi:hypothetical protein MRX96_050846 [Rhipicephalus microplus]